MFEPKIKICGITNIQDALSAIDMGADILGFMFYKSSPRYISPEDALEIVSHLPTFAAVAGVFVNEPVEKVVQIIRDCQLNWVQFQGDETPEYCNEFRYINVRTIKTVHIQGIADLERINKYSTDAVLLDSYTEGEYKGSGTSFDWNMLKSVLAYIDKRIFISGGINNENVREAYEMSLYGIDLCSGVEAYVGKKDVKKLKEFFDIIKSLQAG